MYIGLEATRANKSYKTGTEWYAWHLLQEFKKIDRNNKFNVYYNKYIAGDLKDAPDNFYFKSLPWPFKKFWTHLRLGWELIIRPVDKFFATNALPFFGRGEMIVTIHDLGFYKNPELYHPLERIYQKLSHSFAIKRADKIITISETTKQDIIKYFPSAQNKIKVIYLGYNQDSFKAMSGEDKKEFINQYDYPDKYLLYIGRLENKKNILSLIKAYQKSSRKWPLVLAGRPGNYGYSEIETLANSEDLKDDILLLGYISQINYPKLLAAASAFVFPSKFEGFGLPVLEAMASGVPVTCSAISALQEVAQDNVLYFNPNNIEDIKDKLEIIFNDEEKRNELINKGLKRAKNFSWSKTARETLDYILN
ncbi:MAG: glycosyltransferase family 1 protein [Patescibacteria group bacterium]|jgi:glycosyltransferase involved in cell wall biosynthesis